VPMASGSRYFSCRTFSIPWSSSSYMIVSRRTPVD
jgi:hypothetical protein